MMPAESTPEVTSSEPQLRRPLIKSNWLGCLFSVLAVVVLIALLLPAAEQAREAARRTQSKNNLKQIGISLYNYHDVHRVFPPCWDG